MASSDFEAYLETIILPGTLKYNALVPVALETAITP